MLRKARIKWDTVPNATSYTVKTTGHVAYNDEPQDDGTTIKVKVVQTLEISNIVNTHYDVVLDEYLEESTADTFKVKASITPRAPYRHTGFKAVSTGQGNNKTNQPPAPSYWLQGSIHRVGHTTSPNQHRTVILALRQYPQGGRGTPR